MVHKQRPRVVTFLIAMVTIGSTIPIVVGLMLANNLFLAELYFVDWSSQNVGTTYVILGLIGLTLVYGLLKTLKLIWTVTFVVCVIALFFAIVVLPLGFGGIVIKSVEIYLLTRKKVREFFS